jgi:hypothetical protein
MWLMALMLDSDDEGGSVHAGKTKGLVQKDWPLHDPMGFRAVETSMVDFAHHVFSGSAEIGQQILILR